MKASRMIFQKLINVKKEQPTNDRRLHAAAQEAPKAEGEGKGR